MPSVSTRHTASASGPAASATQISIPRSVAIVSVGHQHTALRTEAKRSSVNNGETISHSTGKEDQSATEEQSSSCRDATEQPCSHDVVAVSVSPDPLLVNTDIMPCTSDDAECPTETAVNQSDETVTQTPVKHEGDATLQEDSACANTADDSDLCNGNLKDVEQSQFVNALSEVCQDVSDNASGRVTGDAEQMSVGQSEVSDSVVNDENLLSVVSEAAEQERAVTVGFEDVITQPHLSPLNEPSVIDATSEQFPASEEVDGTEQTTDIAGDGSHTELEEAPVVSYVHEEAMLCAATGGNKPCVTDGAHLPLSSDTQQPEEMPSAVDVDGHDAACYEENVSQPAADGSDHSECDAQFVDSRSSPLLDTLDTVMDVYLAESPATLSYSDMQSCDLPSACAADAQQLPADTEARVSSPTEMYIQDKDAMFTEQYEKVNFTIGQSSVLENTFRRCSVDLAGRGMLSRIAEESSTGLASVTGDAEQSMESHQLEERAASREYNIISCLVPYFCGKCCLIMIIITAVCSPTLYR